MTGPESLLELMLETQNPVLSKRGFSSRTWSPRLRVISWLSSRIWSGPLQSGLGRHGKDPRAFIPKPGGKTMAKTILCRSYLRFAMYGQFSSPRGRPQTIELEHDRLVGSDATKTPLS